MSDEQPALTPRDALRVILIRYDTDAGMAPGVWESRQRTSAPPGVAPTHQRGAERDRARVHLSREQTERPLISRRVNGNASEG